MTMTRDEKTRPAGADVVGQLKANGALDDLFARIDSGQIELTGDGGMIPALIKEALERGLQAGRAHTWDMSPAIGRLRPNLTGQSTPVTGRIPRPWLARLAILS
ncbi:hypothetical protein [Trueperella abortisuis]|uniref:Transposase n=1 Tax=Trueperella abortisuis TaxID=445930 RepID=A0ABT9PH89_9ACTO|nr:hypothetical protein [Trueperella abortisuis]